MGLISTKHVVVGDAAMINMVNLMERRINDNKDSKGDWQSWAHIIPEEDFISRIKSNLEDFENSNNLQHLADAANNILFLFEKGRLDAWRNQPTKL